MTAASPGHNPRSSRSILIVGPGWLGSEIARRSHEFFDNVYTVSRSPARSLPSFDILSSNGAHRWQHIQMDIRDMAPSKLGSGQSARTPNASGLADDVTGGGVLPHQVDAIILCVAPTRERGDTASSTYAAAAAGAVRLADDLNARALLYTSSTGVYGSKDGEIVYESRIFDMQSVSARQTALLDAEQAVLELPTAQKVRRFVLRLSGLYGPGRDPSGRFSTGDSLNPTSEHWCNFTWRGDAASAVFHFLMSDAENISDGVFNCADGHPVISTDISRALLQQQQPKPTDERAIVRRGDVATANNISSNQKVSIEKIVATGWKPQVDSVFAGLRLLGHHIAE